MIFLRLKLALFIIITVLWYSCVPCRALDISAQCAVAVDRLTGEVVFEKNAHQRRPMASTTKIMTAVCALENGDINQTVTVASEAVGVEGSSVYLAHGEKITLKNLLYGLMLASGNDAAVAVAVHISGSTEKFTELMNATARKIGVSDTSFKNPNGLDDDGHFTTAYDLAMITRYAMKIPEFAEIVGTDSIKIPRQGKDYPHILKNHNKLLAMYEGCDGVKTGFTKKSGRCLVSSATRSGVGIIAVTLNAPDDWNDHMRMLDFAFGEYESREILKNGAYLKTVNVKNGVSENVSALAADGISVPIRKGTLPKIELRCDIPDWIEAPVGYGEKLGTAELYLNGEPVLSVDAVSGESVAWKEKKTFLKSLKKIIENLYVILCEDKI